jgi:hypothetical protein
MDVSSATASRSVVKRAQRFARLFRAGVSAKNWGGGGLNRTLPRQTPRKARSFGRLVALTSLTYTLPRAFQRVSYGCFLLK